MVVVLVAATLAACSSGDPDPGDSASPDTGPAGTDVPAWPSELDATLATEVGALVDAWMERSGVPGVSLAIVGPGLEFTEVAGVVDLGSGEPVTDEDYWRFGSVTKTMTTAALYRLAGEGKVDLDAPVADYLGSGWADGYTFDGEEVGEDLTVKQVLNYTAGFAEYATDPGFYAEALTRLDRPVDPAEIVDWGIRQGAVVAPGSEAKVTTVGHIVAGLVLEEAAGQPAEVVLREQVFTPAGATEAYLPPGDSPPALVTGYLSEGLATLLGAIWPQDSDLGTYEEWRSQAVAQGPAGELFDLTSFPQELLSSVGWTGGGLEARPLDVARAIEAIFGGTVLSEGDVVAMTATVPGGTFAQGILNREVDGEVAFQQSGILPGYNSGILYLPEWNVAIAASANTESPNATVPMLIDEVAVVVRALYSQAATDQAA
jgi:D-alanyl-D-alanine carboxypeptidase